MTLMPQPSVASQTDTMPKLCGARGKDAIVLQEHFLSSLGRALGFEKQLMW